MQPGRWCEQHQRYECTSSCKDGTDCHGPRCRGSDKCRMHLGKRTEIVKLEQQALAAYATLGLPPVEDPLSKLAEVCAQVLAWKDDIGGKVSGLPSFRYENENGGEQLRAEVALWERALDRCERFLTAMARLDIDNRLARITETRATAIIIVFTAALDAAGIEGPQRDAVLAAADEEFARQAGVAL